MRNSGSSNTSREGEVVVVALPENLSRRYSNPYGRCAFRNNRVSLLRTDKVFLNVGLGNRNESPTDTKRTAPHQRVLKSKRKRPSIVAQS